MGEMDLKAYDSEHLRKKMVALNTLNFRSGLIHSQLVSQLIHVQLVSLDFGPQGVINKIYTYYTIY